jgi:hypothetical protein
MRVSPVSSTWQEISVGWFYVARESLSVDSKWRESFFQLLLHGRRVSAGWFYAVGESLPVGTTRQESLCLLVLRGGVLRGGRVSALQVGYAAGETLLKVTGTVSLIV